MPVYLKTWLNLFTVFAKRSAKYSCASDHSMARCNDGSLSLSETETQISKENCLFIIVQTKIIHFQVLRITK